MKKTAIFTEGLTEQLFSEAVIRHLAAQHQFSIQFAYQHAGKLLYEGNEPNMAATHFFLVVDCRNDAQVKTQIVDNYAALVKAGYSSIIGLRDVYPLTQADVPRIESALNFGIPAGAVPVSIHLAVMEVEAWFLAEVSHFPRISNALSVDAIVKNGMDIRSVPPQQWHPASQTLDEIYKIAGLRYLYNDGRKTRSRISRTVKALSIDALLENTVLANVPELSRFIESIKIAIKQ
ncbi:hypothetical protein [Pseudorhodoferax sp.]|uniref:hypothetical protein n=1 Tax=Pseudorhodoferax sp. TaxID=1993553 RepID=UPI002DD6B25D|nr:hypothetical protein [Pseudorhodoferax sp.]